MAHALTSSNQLQPYSVRYNMLMAGVQAWLVNSIHIASDSSSRKYQKLLVWLAQHVVK
jgi:hypothetical protein